MMIDFTDALDILGTVMIALSVVAIFVNTGALYE